MAVQAVLARVAVEQAAATAVTKATSRPDERSRSVDVARDNDQMVESNVHREEPADDEAMKAQLSAMLAHSTPGTIDWNRERTGEIGANAAAAIA